MAPLGHRELSAGLRGPAERIRWDHPDRADGQPAHRVPILNQADGGTTFVRSIVRDRDPREGGRVRGQLEKPTVQRPGQAVQQIGRCI